MTDLKKADATEVAKESVIEFSFKLHGKKHAFQAATKAESDGWLVSIQKAVDDVECLLVGFHCGRVSRKSSCKPAKPG